MKKSMMEELFGGGDSGDGDPSGQRPIGGKELKDLRESFVHLDLKPGDKVRWKKGLKDKMNPGEKDVVEVYSVFPPVTFNGDSGYNHFLDENDSSVALIGPHDKELCIYAFDSRRFEKV